MYSPLEQFTVKAIIGIMIGPLDITISNTVLSLWLVVGTWVLISRLSGYGNSIERSKIIPDRWQVLMEVLMQYVISIAEGQIGKKGQAYIGIAYTLLIFVCISNLIGLIPYTFTATSQLVIAFGMSLSIWIGVTIRGIEKHGLRYINILIPSGVPIAAIPVISLIEGVSYMMRAISLGVRLFANMTAGHCLLAIMAGFAWQMWGIGGVLSMLSIVPVVILYGLTGLEIVIAIIQGYVFTVLTCTYINDAENMH